MTGTSGTRRVVVDALGGVAVFLVGWAAGIRTASPQPTPTPTLAATNGSGSTPVVEQSRAGAVAAARRAAELLSTPAVLDDVSRGGLFARTASPEAAERFEAAYRVALPRLRRSLAIPTSGPVPAGVVMRSVSLGYHVTAYTPREARVALWTVLVLGNGVRVPPQATWRAVDVTLTWTADGWRVTDLADTPGPTPTLLGAPSPAGVFTDEQATYRPHE